ncbi:MAG TPA: hypothetical protein VJU82_08290 [Acidobacteriaceae bacterium]|nr:hypothetical protein [Acidobacteriaceae bacterium]
MGKAQEDLAKDSRNFDHFHNQTGSEPPYFDEKENAWVLSTYSDVMAAFCCLNLSPVGPNDKTASSAPDESAMIKVREETRQWLSPSQLRTWREQLAPIIQAAAEKLAAKRKVDLVEEYARPCCTALAAIVSNIPLADANALSGFTEPISASAAEPYDAGLRSRAKSATAALKRHLQSGTEPLRDSTFVALMRTMPCLLANSWHALLQHPEQWRLLHEQPDFIDHAMEELFRYAGLPRILFRRAEETTDLNGVLIRRGQRVALRIMTANRDSARFAHGDTLDVMRSTKGQLTLGAGPHSCVGAGLIRMAAIAVTRPLLAHFPQAELIEPVNWIGGSGFRAPESLWVRLIRP